MTTNSVPERQKLYVLVLDYLTPAQQAVQAGHAVAKFSNDYPSLSEDWQNNGNILVYLEVESIKHWERVLVDGGFRHSVFHDPDLRLIGSGDYPFAGRGMDTAIAVAPNWMCQYVLFKDLPLAFSETKPKRKRWWRR